MIELMFGEGAAENMQPIYRDGMSSPTGQYYRKTGYHWSGLKFGKNLLILILISALGSICLTSAVKATFDDHKEQIINVTVLHGDTLWSIAKRIAPDVDPRRVIAQIKQQNHLPVSALVAGQELIFELNR
jgi:hypothetical protein